MTKPILRTPQVDKTAGKDEDGRSREIKLYAWEIDYVKEVLEPLYFAEQDNENKKFLARVLSRLN